MDYRRANILFGLIIAVVVGGCASGSQATSESSAPEAAADESSGEETERAEPTPPEGFVGSDVLEVLSTAGGHAVILADASDERVVPIFVGQSQAMAIKLRLERRRYSRPLTHDLLDNVVSELGGELVKVHIDAVKSGVFVGTVYVRNSDQTHEIDARSSDAIALAVGNEAPIFIADAVFEKAGVPKEKFNQGGLQRPRPFDGQPGPEQSPPDEPREESGESEDRPFY